MTDLITIDGRVRKIIGDMLALAELGRNPDFAWDAELVDELGADSLDLVEIAIHLDDKLGVDIRDDELSRWKTAGDVLASVEAQR